MRDLDPDIERGIMRCLARSRMRRPASALAVAALTSGRRSARGGARRRRNAIAGDGRCRRDDRRDEQPAHDDGSRVDGCVPRRRAADVSARAARESRSYSEAAEALADRAQEALGKLGYPERLEPQPAA